MLGANHFDGASLFSGGGFMPSQPPATQAPDFAAKGRGGLQGVIPLTVKQIAEAYILGDDGIDAANVRLLGLVTNKVERVTDVSFTLDDGTGRIDISRWVNETSDANEAAVIQDGMYVKVNGHLKGFHDKRQAMAFSVQPVTDFNDVALHFIECIYVHLENARRKVPTVESVFQGQSGAHPQVQRNASMGLPFSNGLMGYQPPPSNQFWAQKGVDGSGNDVYNLVLGVFQEPSSLAREHGLPVDEVVMRLGIPMNKIMDAINYLVNVGHIYSTIDDKHFKSAVDG